jgi:transmembrane sensor
MTAAGDSADRAAAEWFVLLREEPDAADLQEHFNAWLTADPRHEAAWAEIQETARAILSAPPERQSYDIPRGKAIRRRRRSRRISVPRPQRRPRRWQAASLAVAFACAFVLALPSLMLRLEADHVSAVGAVEIVRLDDGSIVTLGPDSAIAVYYDAAGRNIRLISGQAMFEVVRAPERPFRVAARNVTTTVLGTGFDVRMIGESTGVAVRHGRVRVQDGRTSRELGAGDWVRFTPNSETLAGEVPPDLIGAWRTGGLPIRNRRIADAIEEVRPWYDGKIVLASNVLGEKLVTGTYDVRNPVRSLNLMVAPYGGRVMRITPWLLVVTEQ